MSPRPLFALAVSTVLAAASGALRAQEHAELGRMWTFENAPLDWFERAYGFRPTKAWLDHLRLASLRFGDGCSASFVSPRGLIITNNHCAQEHVGAVAPKDADWVVDGFFATGLAQEVRVPDLTVQQLVNTADVTAAMNEGVTDDLEPAARTAKLVENRKTVLEAAAARDPQHRHELVTLYQGGMYQVYSYKTYTDIRLVCAPPLAIAEFGGDPDNFTYPRFCLDFALLRAWEDGAPADTRAFHLRYKTAGPAEGETVFVTGHPGSTGRLNTIAQMEFMRDVQYPLALQGLGRQIAGVREAMKGDPAQAKELRPQLLMLENAQKAYRGYLDGLEDRRVMDKKRRAEEQARAKVAADPALAARFGDAWTALEKLVAARREGGAARGAAEAAQQAERAAVERVGAAFFAAYGTAIPPDATFTLRISDGVVKGYPYNGTIAPWFTSLYGLYARFTEFGGKPPFALPPEWLEKRAELDLATPFDFVTTCDITGGNSGSPLVDVEGRFVGLVFDGNIESLGNRFVFTDETARTICVHPAIIVLALREVYDRAGLADELEGRGDGSPR
jgi:hypothetical protein